MAYKSFLGSFLNLIVPGLGNFYGRKVLKGFLTYLISLIIVFTFRFTAFNFTLFSTSSVFAFSFLIYLTISGYRDSKNRNSYPSVYFDKWYFYLLVFLVHLILFTTIFYQVVLRYAAINYATVSTPAMEPALNIGDRFAFNSTKEIKRNDVIVFYFPEKENTIFTKRCIGLPGDSLKIYRGKVLINGSFADDIQRKLKYILTTDGTEINMAFLDRYRISEYDYYMISNDTYELFLSEEQKNTFSELPFIKRIELAPALEGQANKMIYPKSGNHHWNTDFYGPIYIPKKGDQISLTRENINYYLNCVEYENQSVEVVTSGLKINGKVSSSYVFKENYYFMLGDNWHNSLDSRFWGLLPEKLVIGKVKYLYWSRSIDRIGKEIN